MEVRKQKGTVSGKYRSAIEALIGENDWTEAEIIKATKGILGDLDSYEMKQAGDRLANSLAADIQLVRKTKAEEEITNKFIESESARLQAEAEAEIRDLEESEGAEAL
jgi:hypothetical protein